MLCERHRGCTGQLGQGPGGVQQKQHLDPNASERWGLPCCSAWQEHLSAAASGSPSCRSFRSTKLSQET